jgi:hypothetical protein
MRGAVDSDGRGERGKGGERRAGEREEGGEEEGGLCDFADDSRGHFYVVMRGCVQAERDKYLNKEIAQLEKDKKSLQSETEKAKKEIANMQQKREEHSEEVGTLEKKVKLFDQDKGGAEAKKLEIYQKEVQLKQQIKLLQKSQHESNKKLAERKREIEEIDKKLDHGMPNGCAKALRFLEDHCARHKVWVPAGSRRPASLGWCARLLASGAVGAVVFDARSRRLSADQGISRPADRPHPVR